ncbi:rapamycin-insensitive companion of mTOR-like isoform X2 [Hydractinia symbiolongicarpus]|nr:rapamycin-insensitive companion of mTOR-like isoform X2 [Hydractinia symbiolongicarpus]
MNESLICTILYLFNHPNYRCYVRRKVGLEPILAPFTDLYYTHHSDVPDNLIKEDRLNRIESAKLAFVAIIRSWSGLVSLCDPDDNNIESVLGVFKLPNMNIRKAIIDTLFEIFCLRQPKMTDDYVAALRSVDPSSMQETWKLTESFLLPEADAVLPHRAQSTRANLIEGYLSLVLCAFIEAGILQSLVQVITTSDDFICIRGSILLGELLDMANMLLPPSYSANTHCLPSLMSLATNLDKTPEERGKASAAVGYLDQLHQMKKRGTVPNTLFMEQLLTQTANNLQAAQKSKSRQDKVEIQCTWRDMDEVLSAIRETQVMLTQDNEYRIWNWDLISTILESPKMSIKRPDEPIFYRFIKRLTFFYKPLQKLYSSINQTDPMARIYSTVALQLTDFLLQREEQPEGERLLVEVLQEIRDCLGEATQPGILNGIFSTQSLNETLARDYFLIIGRLSSSENGLRMLDKTPGVFQYLMEICSMAGRDSLVKLITSCFDYGRNGIARVLLSKSLTASPLSSRLYATKLLRVLLRVKSPYFSNWGIEFLTNQLYDQEAEVVETTIDILEEACEDEANLQRLIEVKPALLHLGDHAIRLMSRYVSVARGFTYLLEMDYLNPLVEVWKTTFNREYVHWIELEIAESLSLYERHGTDGGYIRRSNSKFVQRKDVYVLPHLYGELSKHRQGIQLIQEQNLLSNAINVITQQCTENSCDILHMKAALWSIGHITSTSLGMNLVQNNKRPSQLSTGTDSCTAEQGKEEDDTSHSSEPDIIERIVDMALNCEVLTLRGTCFYVLGLIASTSVGADKLEDLGWESVRHRGSDKWPVIEQDMMYFLESDASDEEQVSETGDEGDAVVAEAPAQERFGGIYLGEDIGDGEDESEPPLSFEYAIYTYGDKERKGKKQRALTSDEARYFQYMSSQSDETIETNMKMKFFDVNSQGYMYEKGSDGLLSGLERLNSNSGIYLGEDSSVPFSEHKPPDYSNPDTIRGFKSFEDFMPFLAGKNPDATSPVADDADSCRSSMKTKAIFDDAGIYLGEEEIEDQIDDSMNDSSEYSASPTPSYDRAHSTDIAEPLKPIREEKSQESLNSKSGIDVFIEEEISVEYSNDKKSFSNVDSSNDTSTLDSSVNIDDHTPTQSPVVDEKSRFRSISLNDGAHRTENEATSPRSSSFSGTAMYNKLTTTTQNQIRSDSDPGVGLVQSSIASSVSSQESDLMRPESGPNIKNFKRLSGRKKSRSENEDVSDRDRSNSIISDSSSGIRLRTAKRLRGGSTLSLGISPKSARGLSAVTYESPYSSSYSRDGSYGYTAWQTLKKQRSFKKELDSTLRRQSGVSERRKSSKSLAYQYRRLMDISTRRGSTPVMGVMLPRRQISTASSGGMVEVIASEAYSSPSEDYVGRCLPNNLAEFFSVTPYEYLGSWADNSVEFSESNNLQTFDNKGYVHARERCLACKTIIDKGGKIFSEQDLPDHLKSRTSSKDSPEDDDSECSERETENKNLKQKLTVHKEVLRLVVNLSSAVASKGTQQEILSLRSRFPWAFQDLCLYSQVMERLGMYSFRLTMRRFIQALFEGVNYSLIFETADNILGRNLTEINV